MIFYWKCSKLHMTEQTLKPLTKQIFYSRNWDGPNRIRRCELDFMANYFNLEFNSSNSNHEIFLKIDNYWQNLALCAMIYMK